VRKLLSSGTGVKRPPEITPCISLAPDFPIGLVKCGFPSTRPLGFVASFPVVPSAARTPPQIHCSGPDSPTAS
jgi:hypothetical protein